jgi:hypothetical protein
MEYSLPFQAILPFEWLRYDAQSTPAYKKDAGT